VQILAVDDDPVSNLAMALALKKILRPPDVAENGKAALALAASQNYDAIFLDVDMPGMDGFELCTWIHQMERHRHTPVVFVTRYNNVHTRARVALSGGESLIAKPFISGEIAVKALTLTLRGRLKNGATADVSCSKTETVPHAARCDESPDAQPGRSRRWEEIRVEEQMDRETLGRARRIAQPDAVVQRTSAQRSREEPLCV
jgi:CheY-like chemotaxis protein